MMSSTKLLVTIWGLANQETFRQLADQFSLTRAYAHYIFMYCCRILTDMARNVIIWPSHNSVMHIASSNSLPGAFASIDGSHICIKTPLALADSYINRKSYASIVLQAVCTPNLQFIDVSTGWPGCMHDARIYRRSKVHKFINGGKLDRGLHILGDSAYPLQENLMVPYRDNGHLSEKQKKFNYIHSASRCCVERAFGLLKCKFRRLRYLDISNLHNAPAIIIASCTLHNFILQNESDIPDVNFEIDDDVVCIEQDGSSSANKAAAHKRDAIASQL